MFRSFFASVILISLLRFRIKTVCYRKLGRLKQLKDSFRRPTQSIYAAPTLYVSPLLSALPTMAATAAAKPLRVMYFCGISWASCVKV